MTMEIKTVGIRTDLAHYFAKCLIVSEELTHNKVLALRNLGGVLVVEEIKYLSHLVNIKEESVCIGVWIGKTRTDHFVFTVKQFKMFLEAQ